MTGTFLVLFFDLPPQSSPNPPSSPPLAKPVRELLREERRALIVDQRASRTTAAVWGATSMRGKRCRALTRLLLNSTCDLF